MSLENEKGKCQLTSCENRMSIEDRVLKILACEYIHTTILTNGEYSAQKVRPSVRVLPLFPDNRSKDFLAFWHKVRGQ